MNQKTFHSKVKKLCEKFGGKLIEKNYCPAWAIQTPKYGQLNITPIDDWIALRFETFSTGKVYDSLLGFDFNGYSSKWNILMSSQNGVAVRRKESLINLEYRLERLFENSPFSDLVEYHQSFA